MAHRKRLSAPKHYKIARKQNTYISDMKGSRSRENAIPTVLLLRDVLEYAETEKEAKKIVKEGELLRNNKPVRDIKEGIGILDIVEIPKTEEKYRAIRKGKYIEFIPVERKEIVAKITDKSIEGEEFIYRLHNGENYRTKDEYQTGNSLIFEDNSVEEVELEEETKTLVIKGKHAGKTGEIQEINRRGRNKDTATIENSENFETQTENLVAIKNNTEVE